VCAIDRRGPLEGGHQGRLQTRHRQVRLGFELGQAVFDQDQVAVEEQVAAGHLRRVVPARTLPSCLLGGRQLGRRLGFCGSGGLAGCPRPLRLLSRLLIKKMMQVDPEAAVKLEDRDRRLTRRLRCRRRRQQERAK